MCGIAGFVGFEDKTLIKKMCDVIEHRGPDDHGYYYDKNVCLGVRRLSIIDVKGGKQPVHNEDETVWVVFNGEIYNHIVLRANLEKKGHKFYTKSDTEVLVHLYEEYGEDFVAKLRGMFAFAVWDSVKKKLFLARDRMGKKPLYYYQNSGRFYFASEIKSILEDKRVPRTVDRSTLNDFLVFRASVGEKTMFKNIMKLPPGHTMSVNRGKISVRTYWEIKMSPEDLEEKYFLELLKNKMKEAVRLRMVSEVPLGAYLSGGVDSSTVVALMKNFSDKPVRTFSVGFGNDFDETKYAKEVSEALGTEHTEFIVEQDSMKILPDVVWHFDEPVADPAAIPTYVLSENAKKHVTVVMTGEGADEVFAGYFQYKVVTQLSSPLKKKIALLTQLAPKSVLDRIFEYSSSLGEKGMERFSAVVKEDDERARYTNIVAIFDDPERKELTGAANKNFLSLFPKPSGLNSMLVFDIKTELPDDLLMKVDKMTMARSIEARAPFLDQEVVELASRMPENLKLHGTKDKYILRKLAAGLLPEAIAKRKKHRFFLPIDEWGLKEISAGILTRPRCRETGLDYNYMEKIFKNFEKSKLYYSRQIWSLLNFELWHRIYIEEEDPRKIRRLL